MSNTTNFNKKNTQNQASRHQSLYQEQNIIEGDTQDANIDEIPEFSEESTICNISNRGRVVILIDGSNLFYAALQLGIEIDYSKLLSYLVKDGRLLRAFFYSGVDRTNDKQQGFLLWMRRNGYRVVTKDVVQFPDGSKKANLEVEIAVDMMTLASHCDTVVLVSGDGDLAYAVNAVSYKGVRVEIVSLHSMTSESLINYADCFIDLDSIKKEIEKVANTSYI
ncbi:NYN domain-containing protein [Fischerella thermalis CCMEE 5198]|jgi:uncharacterized LabA/DUF88 family protein|uniref:LabA-like NYN domain-containing protein n=1 Tax=Fischerella thermalis TaxID=372787 RepID=UPI000C80626C|nr:NYN domain-containing protein [Fischerella thermalis]PMB05850.1 NYN domain-containing protein [Fischerella thermalis CCMEE 5196]PMB26721.1 NYN domain-containing protein [Fischerella thermalis CCMEE 5198]